jgi:tetratricopeptide (TPR) repeat protein
MSSIRSITLILALATGLAPLAAAQMRGIDRGAAPAVPGQDEDGPSLSKVFQTGVDYLVDGDCKRAEEMFERVLDKVPRNSETNYLRGVALQCMDRYDESVRYFRRAKRDDADFFQAYGGLGISYLALERPEKAHREFEELAKFKRLCEQGHRRCPPELLKAYEKLRTAIERVEGAAPGEERGSAYGGEDRRDARALVDTSSPVDQHRERTPLPEERRPAASN